MSFQQRVNSRIPVSGVTADVIEPEVIDTPHGRLINPGAIQVRFDALDLTLSKKITTTNLSNKAIDKIFRGMLKTLRDRSPWDER